MKLLLKATALLTIIAVMSINTVAISSVRISTSTIRSNIELNDCGSCHSKKINSKNTHFIESSEDCKICHLVNQNNNNHQILSLKDNDGCVTCHIEQSEMNSEDAHNKLYCIQCHNPHGSSQEYMFEKNVVTLCRESCHMEEQLGNSHAVGGEHIDERTGQQLTCVSTCHKLHNAKEEKLLQYSQTYVCQECHQEMY